MLDMHECIYKHERANKEIILFQFSNLLQNKKLHFRVQIIE